MMKALRRLRWAYLLLHMNINFGNFNLLPNWISFFIIHSTIPVIANEEKSASLLKPLVQILAILNMISWIFGSINTFFPIFSLIQITGSLYLHFQLFTNLASIAKKYYFLEASKLLKLRTFQTLLTTFMSLPFNWNVIHPWAINVIGLMELYIATWIWILLFKFENHLKEKLPS